MVGKLSLRKSSLCGLLYVTLTLVTNAEAEDALAKFGDVVPVLGQMARTDQDFVDGLALDLFSPSNRTLVVTNNSSPLPGNFVSGTTGEGFVNLSKYSWVIKFNETANDLIAKIELPYDPVALASQGVQVANTYVGKLAKDKKSWVISETQRNVHMTENKTRIIKMTSLDGEYMLLGRKSADTANMFVQYGQGATRTVNITGGAEGVQEAEFVDGLRFRVQSAKPFALNVDIPFGVNDKAIPDHAIPLINREMFEEKTRGHEEEHLNLLVARRELNAPATACFEPVKKQEYIKAKRLVEVRGLTAVDGQYVILVSKKRYPKITCGQEGDAQTCPARNSTSACAGEASQARDSDLNGAQATSRPAIVTSVASLSTALAMNLVVSCVFSMGIPLVVFLLQWL
ncbi:hypothetical protein MAC_04488 [Metarhizium acridum CQMa 102]|uniref:Paired amphipathic helix protein Sin3a n=1 Tax=Metarhizium acridum (strain CQMa 102) TaxID=655827 RepID=E9E3P4_METAQ|nr:uncharacterized protein MAC_04488 [Metarhizium acridum CQMa 102]EFY89469.1 hypothetical protein MAC_04488 [Metarhizium acridum CQMa 102]